MKWLEMIVFIGLAFVAAAVGSLFAPGDWYWSLAKPAWNPPSWIFGPVWTVLYLMIGLSGWHLWQARDLRSARVAIALWATQLVLNSLWSWLFFGLHRPDIAFVEILVLLVAIGCTAVAAWPASRTATILLIPYFGWVGFASILNLWLWRLNT